MSTTTQRRRWRRTLTIAALTVIGLLAGAGVAAAHVTVNPSQATAGDYTKLTFRVPNESPTAGTVALTVTIPADHPFASVAVQRIPGWTVTPTRTTLPAPITEGDVTIKEAVTSISWTAEPGTSIAPGEFAEFSISAGPVPEVEAIEFPTTQTYDDGTVVQWDEPTPASGAEPEHPAPTLTVAPAAGSAAGEGTAAGVDGAEDDAGHSHADGAAQAAGTADSGSSVAVTVLAVVSLVLAAAALLVAAVALRRRPARQADPATGPAAGTAREERP